MEHIQLVFLKMYQENKSEKAIIEEKLHVLQQQHLSVDEVEKELQHLKNRLDEMKQIEEIDRTVVDNFIERIVVNNDGNVTIILKFSTSFDMSVHSPIVIYSYAQEMIANGTINNVKFLRDMENWKKEIVKYLSVRCVDEA